MGPQPFRGQYAVSRSAGVVPPGFENVEIGAGWFLHAHRELPVAITRGERGAAVLVGHAVNWAQPEQDQQQVLEWLIGEWSREEVVRRSSGLAGRWVLIVLGDESYALNDACGTMGVVWSGKGLAASAQLLEQVAGPMTPIVRERFDEHRSKSHSGRPIPGTSTEFAEARKLLGNHLLDLDAGCAVRFHPTQRYPDLPAAQLADKVAEILTGIISAIARRGSLAAGLTAGYDSRALAAALSTVPGLVDKTTFFTMQDQYACPPGHSDILGARRIAEAVRGPHQVLEAPTASAAAQAACRASEHMIAPRFESWAEAWSSRSLEGRIVLSGWCSETGRARLRWEGSEDATPTQLLGCLDAMAFPEFLPDIQQWHSEARRIRDELNLPIIDLLYWELKGGGWISAGLNILNTGADCLSVYSCRDLLDAMLSVVEEQRGGKDEPLYNQLIGRLRPELLAIPFNPRGFIENTRLFVRKDLRNAAIRMTKRAGLYETVRKLRGRPDEL